jgi:hypothetical protein
MLLSITWRALKGPDPALPAVAVPLTWRLLDYEPAQRVAPALASALLVAAAVSCAWQWLQLQQVARGCSILSLGGSKQAAARAVRGVSGERMGRPRRPHAPEARPQAARGVSLYRGPISADQHLLLHLKLVGSDAAAEEAFESQLPGVLARAVAEVQQRGSEASAAAPPQLLQVATFPGGSRGGGAERMRTMLTMHRAGCITRVSGPRPLESCAPSRARCRLRPGGDAAEGGGGQQPAV